MTADAVTSIMVLAAYAIFMSTLAYTFWNLWH